MMRAYAEDYLSDVVETQGKLFDFVAQELSLIHISEPTRP